MRTYATQQQVTASFTTYLAHSVDAYYAKAEDLAAEGHAASANEARSMARLLNTELETYRAEIGV